MHGIGLAIEARLQLADLVGGRRGKTRQGGQARSQEARAPEHHAIIFSAPAYASEPCCAVALARPDPKTFLAPQQEISHKRRPPAATDATYRSRARG